MHDNNTSETTKRRCALGAKNLDMWDKITEPVREYIRIKAEYAPDKKMRVL